MCSPTSPRYTAKRGQPDGDAARTINGSDDLAEYLLEKYGVAVVPGSGFGADANIRLSYATSMPNIQSGVARIAEAVQALIE